MNKFSFGLLSLLLSLCPYSAFSMERIYCDSILLNYNRESGFEAYMGPTINPNSPSGYTQMWNTENHQEKFDFSINNIDSPGSDIEILVYPGLSARGSSKDSVVEIEVSRDLSIGCVNSNRQVVLCSQYEVLLKKAVEQKIKDRQLKVPSCNIQHN